MTRVKTIKKVVNNILEPELIPLTMWRMNVRAVISKQNWDALRWSFGSTSFPPSFARSAARELGLPEPKRQKELKCRYCKASQNNLELHELWKYDDKHLVQKLVGLIPVCKDCHLSLHLGYANKINLGDRAKQHLATLNNWSAKETDKYVKCIFKKWVKRSQNNYRLDLTYLEKWFSDSKIHFKWLEKPHHWVGNRIDAIAWAQNILKTDAVIVDTETTGLLDYKKAEVIEIAVLTMKGKVLYSSRFRPRYKIPKRVIEIHGITNKDVKDNFTFNEEYSNFIEQLHEKTVIAYNAKFDQGIIERTCNLYKKLYPECRWECAMHIYRAFNGSSKWLPLPESKHNAVDDCKALLKIIKRMAKG